MSDAKVNDMVSSSSDGSPDAANPPKSPTPRPSTGGTKKACSRKYGQGSYTARIVNGVACCPSCGLPCKEH